MGIYCVTGNGLLFSEGAEWKKKKKIMSSVFNFDFLKSKIKTISAIAK
jgi:cytochrome P450